MVRFQITFLCVLVSLFGSSESIQCLDCLSQGHAHSKCNLDPDYRTQQCHSSAEGCYTLVRGYDDYIRGCAQMSDINWRETCRNLTVLGCTFCKTDNCNDQFFRRVGSQQCVVCKGDECLTKTELTKCTDLIFHSNPQFCYYYLANRTVAEKGCGARSSPAPVGSDSVIVCQGMGCNLELPHTYSACYSYEGIPNEYWKKTLTPCHNRHSQYWHPGCFHQAPIKDNPRILTGCLSSLDPKTAQNCTKKRYQPHCQYCSGDECNKLPFGFNYTNRCQAPGNAIEYCTDLHTRCYVSWLRVPAGNNKTMIQINAGCAEPALNQLLIMAAQTHFCYNNFSVEVPCMEINGDFSNRISCYVCRDCENVYDMDHRIKHICPVGTTHCYQVVARDLRVRRGCYHPNDKFQRVCDDYVHSCGMCDYNYCNFNRVGKSSTAMCHKTRPYNHRKHLMTMRLEDCMGWGLMKLWGDCYLATLGGYYIEAGCMNELEAEDNRKYKTLTIAGVGVLGQNNQSCYKCVSNQTEFCHSVQYLQPEKCKYHQQFAIRGCYTLVKRNSIQRGCLTELDLYYQKMCTSPNFEEVCITCLENFCNIVEPFD